MAFIVEASQSTFIKTVAALHLCQRAFSYHHRNHYFILIFTDIHGFSEIIMEK